jgi:hypothetical protein
MLNHTQKAPSGAVAPCVEPHPDRAQGASGPAGFARVRYSAEPLVEPITVKAATKLVRQWHRHLPEVQGGLFAVAVAHGNDLVAVGVAGNPARVWQGTGRFAITRVAATDGPWSNPDHEAPYCTMIYGSLCRAGKALGYQEAWTYTLPWEKGGSLRGAGFWNMGLTKDGEWSRPSRARNAAICRQPKRRWVRPLTPEAAARIVAPIVEAIVAFARYFGGCAVSLAEAA